MSCVFFNDLCYCNCLAQTDISAIFNNKNVFYLKYFPIKHLSSLQNNQLWAPGRPGMASKNMQILKQMLCHAHNASRPFFIKF